MSEKDFGRFGWMPEDGLELLTPEEAAAKIGEAIKTAEEEKAILVKEQEAEDAALEAAYAELDALDAEEAELNRRVAQEQAGFLRDAEEGRRLNEAQGGV